MSNIIQNDKLNKIFWDKIFLLNGFLINPFEYQYPFKYGLWQNNWSIFSKDVSSVLIKAQNKCFKTLIFENADQENI